MTTAPNESPRTFGRRTMLGGAIAVGAGVVTAHTGRAHANPTAPGMPPAEPIAPPAAAAPAAPTTEPTVAPAAVQPAMPQAPTPGRDVLVIISLWGGADGLAMCSPVGDPDFARYRPAWTDYATDRYEPNLTENLDGFFAMPNVMRALTPVYRAGDLAFVHTAGHPDTSRSHFDAQRLIELGRNSFGQEQWGWIGRHLQQTPAFDAARPLRAITWNNNMATTLFGGPKTIPLQPGANLSFFGTPTPRFRQLLDADYSVLNTPPATIVAQGHSDMNAAISLLQEQFKGPNPITIDQATLTAKNYKIDVNPSPAIALHTTAELIRRDIGLEVVMVQGTGEWDSHEAERHHNLFNNLYGGPGSLARNLAAFHAETSDLNVTTVVISEFGRTIELNAAGGTDHGRGQAMIVMGRNVAGNQVIGRSTWPGLRPEVRWEGRDLPALIDVRDIFGEILRKRMATANMPAVFPDYAPVERGVIG